MFDEMIREPLDDPPTVVPIRPTTIADLEVKYLTLLMKRDAKIWAERTQYGGAVDDDEDEANKARGAVSGERER